MHRLDGLGNGSGVDNGLGGHVVTFRAARALIRRSCGLFLSRGLVYVQPHSVKASSASRSRSRSAAKATTRVREYRRPSAKLANSGVCPASMVFVMAGSPLLRSGCRRRSATSGRRVSTLAGRVIFRRPRSWRGLRILVRLASSRPAAVVNRRSLAICSSRKP